MATSVADVTTALHELDVVPAQVLAEFPDLPSLLLTAVAAQS
ncbi:hypothetical protein [Actinomycetospora flava]|uniref:FXSXX-COOH protein n=1 Tax=Actinomycetospora flava TaxID=3129232 RepID=A0ABU8MGT3_9PSEU